MIGLIVHSIDGLRQGMDAHDEVVRRVSEDACVPFVDLSEMNGRMEYFYDDCHFSEAGVAEFAHGLRGTSRPWRVRRSTETDEGRRVGAVSRERTWWVGLLLVLVGYVLLCAAILPENPGGSQYFRGDAYYMAIVAGNLLEGRGYVNDAHWVVFLHPEALPIPYHNLGPFFPTVVAATSAVLRTSIPTSQVLVPVFASALLMLAVALLAYRFDRRPVVAIVTGLGTALVPIVYVESHYPIGDLLCAALFFCAVAALVRSERWWSGAATGLFIGLAWLTREQIVIALPAVIFYAIAQGTRLGRYRGEWGRVARYVLVMGVVAVVTVSPWLVRQQRVWGTPLRSDGSVSLIQNQLAHELEIPVERVWARPEAPPGLLEFVSADPAGFARTAGWGTLVQLKGLVRWWVIRSGLLGVALGGALVFFLWKRRRRLLSAEGLAVALVGASYVLVLSPRWPDMEPRYVNTLNVLFAMFAVIGCVDAWELLRPLRLYGRTWSRTAGYGLRALVVIVCIAVIRIDLQIVSIARRPQEFMQKYLAIAREMQDRFAPQGPVVVWYPYGYTFETGAPALRNPESDDAFLLKYMERYGAEFVLLTDWQLNAWRPQWVSGDDLPDWLVRVPDMTTANLYRRVPAGEGR